MDDKRGKVIRCWSLKFLSHNNHWLRLNHQIEWQPYGQITIQSWQRKGMCHFKNYYFWIITQNVIVFIRISDIECMCHRIDFLFLLKLCVEKIMFVHIFFSFVSISNRNESIHTLLMQKSIKLSACHNLPLVWREIKRFISSKSTVFFLIDVQNLLKIFCYFSTIEINFWLTWTIHKCEQT